MPESLTPFIDNCPSCGAPFVRADPFIERTLVGYVSPPGHNHDDNCALRGFYCMDGHGTLVRRRNRCDACNWRGAETCNIHPPHIDVDEWPGLLK